MILYSKDGEAITCDSDQKAILLASGYTVEKTEEKEKVEKVEKQEKGEDKKVVDDFAYKTEEELASMKVKDIKEYNERLEAHKAKLAGV